MRLPLFSVLFLCSCSSLCAQGASRQELLEDLRNLEMVSERLLERAETTKAKLLESETLRLAAVTERNERAAQAAKYIRKYTEEVAKVETLRSSRNKYAAMFYGLITLLILAIGLKFYLKGMLPI